MIIRLMESKSVHLFSTSDVPTTMFTGKRRYCIVIAEYTTSHSARHTNAVLLLENGADIYTVSKRLGNREIRTVAFPKNVV